MPDTLSDRRMISNNAGSRVKMRCIACFSPSRIAFMSPVCMYSSEMYQSGVKWSPCRDAQQHREATKTAPSRGAIFVRYDLGPCDVTVPEQPNEDISFPNTGGAVVSDRTLTVKEPWASTVSRVGSRTRRWCKYWIVPVL